MTEQSENFTNQGPVEGAYVHGGVEITISRMAHGGEGVGHLPDGKVAFISGAFPGDTVEARITKIKKNFVFGQVISIISPGPYRVPSRCPAAQLGAGCCDFHELDPAAELEFKVGILQDQLQRIAKVSTAPLVDTVDLQARGWRTRVRLGVDSNGRAGLRKRGSHELVTTEACSQLAPGLVSGIVGSNASRFTPGSELVVVIDANGERHVVETCKAARGRRVEKTETVIEGSGTVTEKIGDYSFTFPATAFWQGHLQAPETYSAIVRNYLAKGPTEHSGEFNSSTTYVAWDLYGGVGSFVPAIVDGLSHSGEHSISVVSVDYSPAATAMQQPDLAHFDVQVFADKVEKVAAQLPKPVAVLLDPPRVGADKEVVSTIAAACPKQVVHIGCDPATFARDVAYWQESGFTLTDLSVVNAFPGTHHFEVIARLAPSSKETA